MKESFWKNECEWWIKWSEYGEEAHPTNDGYHDALKADPFEVLMEYLNENYGTRENVFKTKCNWDVGRNNNN